MCVPLAGERVCPIRRWGVSISRPYMRRPRLMESSKFGNVSCKIVLLDGILLIGIIV